ncbi:class I SAM-dependent methyltransferase [Pseudomonas sp. PDM14]|uniref:class I SAM-dependent methyltransferase n=1 Tax=Pseudomonas sp. PDM14 TaxID=2769288 RepID=UPI00177DFC02|nr:class I SAM-dependent methyltransferase [Pseudomonas sp. PDM14]MBD9482734.1 class I SAM-dependent methyltransferase [Pseudomonas sp. PDM14]
MSDFLRVRYPAVRALLAQVLALVAVALLLIALLQLGNWRVPLWQAALLQGVCAAGLGQWLGLRRWWLPLNFAFVPALLALQARELPSAWFLGAFLLLLLINWNSFREQVPLYLSGARTRRRLSERLVDWPADFRFIDLGCGLGGTLVQLARDYPQARLVGVETAPLVFLCAWLRCLPRRNCQVRYRSLWHEDLAPYDVAYCFLSPAPMGRLWQKVQTQMRPGSLLISNTFAIPDVPADEVIELDDWRDSRLLIWRR